MAGYDGGHAALSFSASGDNTVVAAQTGKTIRVHAIALTAASPVTVAIKDGASTTLGSFQNVTSLSIDQFDGAPRYVLTSGNALIINLGAAVSCTGTIWYTVY